MIDFKKLLSPEMQERWDENQEQVIQQKLEFANLSNDNLANSIEFYLSQMREPRKWVIGDCVYDAVFYHIIIPELVRRLRKTLKEGD